MVDHNINVLDGCDPNDLLGDRACRNQRRGPGAANHRAYARHSRVSRSSNLHVLTVTLRDQHTLLVLDTLEHLLDWVQRWSRSWRPVQGAYLWHAGCKPPGNGADHTVRIGGNMRSKLCMLMLSAAVIVGPAQAFAQQEPAPPDGASMNASPSGVAVDVCGNPMVPGATGAAPTTMNAAPATATTPAQGPTDNAKDDTLAGQQLNLSSVTGTIVHVEGNLFLVDELPTGSAVANQPAKDTMAVVQLPAGCTNPALPEGSQVTAVGTPTNAGILQAQSIQLDWRSHSPP
jgi:hypothetical protein